MSTQPCKQPGCGLKISFRSEGGRWIPINPDGSEHWLTCLSPDARERRIRMGREPGYYPVSMSQINDYRDCPWYFLARYWERLRSLGLVPQALLERYPAGLPQPPQHPLAALGHYGHRYIAAALKGEELPELDIDVDHVESWRIMRNTFEGQLRRGEWDTEHLYGIEEPVSYEWAEGAMTVQMKGVLDFLVVEGREAVLTDWKFGWKVPPTTWLEQEQRWDSRALAKDLEAQVHALLVKRLLPQLTRLRFQQVHFRYGGRVIPVEFDLENLEEFDQALRAEVRSMIRETAYRPSRGCQVCPLGSHPADDELDAFWHDVRIELANGELVIPPLRRPQTIEDAQRLALATRFCDRVAAAGKEILGDYAADNGPIFVAPGAGYGYKPTREKVIRDIRQALEILDAAGLLEDGAAINGNRLNSYLTTKRYRGVADKLRTLISYKLGSEFGWLGPRDELLPVPPDDPNGPNLEGVLQRSLEAVERKS